MTNQLLAEATDPMTFIPDLDCLAAFRLLIHAEFEEFLELKAKENLNAMALAIDKSDFDAWAKTDIFIISSILFSPLIINNPFDRPEFLIQVKSLLKIAGEWVTENNGIKATSFYQLSIFAGKSIDDLDHGLAASLTSYGKNRGDVAHKSVTRVTTLLAPTAEEKAAFDILTGLKVFFYGA